VVPPRRRFHERRRNGSMTRDSRFFQLTIPIMQCAGRRVAKWRHVVKSDAFN
jgi:hypothetical protein